MDIKKLMERKLPDNIIYRSKKGFGIPLSEWIRKDLRNEIHDTLLIDDHLFNIGYIENLLNEHYDKKQNHRKLIWNLYVLKKCLLKNGYGL